MRNFFYLISIHPCFKKSGQHRIANLLVTPKQNHTYCTPEATDFQAWKETLQLITAITAVEADNVFYEIEMEFQGYKVFIVTVQC